jgi:hypothetical protein
VPFGLVPVGEGAGEKQRLSSMADPTALAAVGERDLAPEHLRAVLFTDRTSRAGSEAIECDID